MYRVFFQWAIRALFAVNLGVGIILFTPLNAILHAPLVVDEAPGHGEVIVILASGIYPNGLPDFSTLVRLRKGVTLYRQHVAPKIMTLGGGVRGKDGRSYAETMADELVHYYNIPREAILTHGETSHTYADITSMVARFNNDFDFNRSIFVSSAYHTYRIKKILLKKNIAGPVVSAESYETVPLRRIDRLVFFRDISREYVALIYSWGMGWLEF
ncbi:MAG: YdcF family protein [Nitrospirae bacterium]|nr:YdcF family protein [Magnetococcales bacterium]